MEYYVYVGTLEDEVVYVAKGTAKSLGVNPLTERISVLLFITSQGRHV